MQPMLATRAADPAALPAGPERASEVRWDVARPLADTGGDQLRLLGRTGRDVAVVDGVPSFAARARTSTSTSGRCREPT